MTQRYFIRLLALSALLFVGSCEEETLDDQAFGTLEGKVVTQGDNTPVENVKITTSPSSNTVFTDRDGNFRIPDILVGDYSVQAEQEDFQAAFEPASILAGKTTNVVFELDSLQAANLRPRVPLLLAPEDKQTDVLSPVEFVWSSAANDQDPITYSLELRNGNTGATQTFEALADTVLVVEDLAIGANYFWQVTATDDITEPVQSKIGSFQLRGVSQNRYLFVRNLEGNNVIFSGGEPGGTSAEVNQNEIQLTASGINAYRPKANRLVGKIAYIRTVGGEAHIFTMNLDGTDQKQLTAEVPVAAFRQDEVEFAWYPNGSALYYPNFNKVYSINLDGSGVQVVYEAAVNEFITEIAVSPGGGELALKLNDAQGYNAEVRTVNLANGQVTRTVISGVSGALGGIDYAPDGNRILYTRDVSGTQNNQYRQLDTRIFEYDLVSGTAVEIDTRKPAGFNTLDAKYAPNGGSVIYTYTSNDGISERSIRRKQLDTEEFFESEVVFTNASMPDWE